MNCPKILELINQSEVLHKQALAQIQQFCDTFSDMRPKNDLNIFTELRKINTEYESLKKQIFENLKVIEDLLQFFTYKEYRTDLHPFMLETYKKLSYGVDQLKTVESVTSNPDNIHIDEEMPFDEMMAVNLEDIKWVANKSKAGELYLTGESIDFETAKLFIPNIPIYIAKRGISVAMKYIHETYKDTHTIPDLKYYQYLAQLGDQYNTETDPVKKEAILEKIPIQLQDGRWYYFPGSTFVNESGFWEFLGLGWIRVGFKLITRRVDDDWNFENRVVLLEK